MNNKTVNKLKKAKYVTFTTDNGVTLRGKIHITSEILSHYWEHKDSIGVGAELTELRRVKDEEVENESK